MGKALIIAEKPSVASDISKALGKFQKQDDYYENDSYVISSAVGHLLTIIPPPRRPAIGIGGVRAGGREVGRQSPVNFFVAVVSSAREAPICA